MNCTPFRSWGTLVFTSSPQTSAMPSRLESAVQRWSRRETGNTSPLCETVLVGARYVTSGEEKTATSSVFQS